MYLYMSMRVKFVKFLTGPKKLGVTGTWRIPGTVKMGWLVWLVLVKSGMATGVGTILITGWWYIYIYHMYIYIYTLYIYIYTFYIYIYINK